MNALRLLGSSTAGAVVGVLVAVVVAVGETQTAAVSGGGIEAFGAALVIAPQYAVVGSVTTALIVCSLLVTSRLVPRDVRRTFWFAFATVLAGAISVSVVCGGESIVESRTDPLIWMIAQLARSPLAAFVLIATVFLALRRGSRMDRPAPSDARAPGE